MREKATERYRDVANCFFEYSGHVNTLDFRIYEDGWQIGDMGYRNWDIDISKPIPEKTVEGIENFCALCLENKKESDVLSRDITKLMNKINEEKEQLKRLRKQYRKLERMGR